MSALSKKLRKMSDSLISYWCQGCKSWHTIKVKGEGHPRWEWNGNVEMPTFKPSVLVAGRDFTEKGWADYDAWIEAGCPKPAPTFEGVDTRCHTFITDGMVQFLNDCTHEYAGQTLPLPDFPETQTELGAASGKE